MFIECKMALTFKTLKSSMIVRIGGMPRFDARFICFICKDLISFRAYFKLSLHPTCWGYQL